MLEILVINELTPMEKDILVIRGNITHAVERFAMMAKEREEREKAEREEKFKREAAERALKEDEWKKEHPILDRFTYISYYNHESYSWPGEYVNIRFYEWSDINSVPKHFPYSIEFYRFLDASKINLTAEQNSKLKYSSGYHVICIPNTHDLIIAKTYEELKTEFYKAENLSKILAPVPDVKAPMALK